MPRRACFLWIILAALAAAPPAHAASQTANRTIALKAGRLADSLRELSVRTGTDLLFSPDVVAGLRSPRVSNSTSVDQALQQLLDGSGLTYQRTGAGTIIVVRGPAEPPTALPEVLVIGRKTQNADIRRTENDIQGYRVATAQDIRSSHADNLDQFLRARQSANGERQGPSSEPSTQYGSNRSEVNLHGLGSNQTLVLIDGARMPGIPSLAFVATIDQPDLNGLPLLAIARIESLTGTAGGIYGPGATGGVVNVVLKRDYRGADLSAAYGLSDRGDAARRRVDGRLGFTPNGGRTDMMINFSHAVSDGLRVGDRSYGQDLRRILSARNPGAYIRTLNVPDGVVFRSLSGETLTLNTALGGATLGSSFTFLPSAHSGVGANGAALLAGAGKVPVGLSPDGNGVARTLTSDTAVSSLLLNVRHSFSDSVEAFVDFIGFENTGRSVDGLLNTGEVSGVLEVYGLASEAATNAYPFRQITVVTFPLQGFDANQRNRLRTTRLSTGVIVRLPNNWRAEASYNDGWVRNTVREDGFVLNPQTFRLGQPGPAGEPAPNPFDPWTVFMSALQAYKRENGIRIARRNHLQDASLRLAGPLLRTDAGDVVLSLLAQRRQERVALPPFILLPSGRTPKTGDPSFAIAVSSLYGELRAPIIPRATEGTPLRGLELQLAVRYDENQADMPGDSTTVAPRIHPDQSATAYTAGVRVFPRADLMVRASVATGVLPPTPAQMLSASATSDYRLYPDFAPPSYADPKRGGRRLGTETPFTFSYGGSSRLRPERARTLAVGVVLNPDGGGLPRISLDYTHVEKQGEITRAHSGDFAYFLAHESLYPDRVARTPLSPADAALGFTGGAITQIDVSDLNIGATTSDAVDVNLDYAIRVGQADRLRFYGAATWTPRLTRRYAPEAAALKFVGMSDGPLRWRGNAGIDWDHEDLTVSFNGQYYDDYHEVGAGGTRTGLPGSYVPSQVYIDASLIYRLDRNTWRGPARDVEISLGVQNLLDRAPPVAANSTLGYSFHGDARRRRFEVGLTARF